MQLTGLSFQNYKAFAGKEAVEIRPLTILIGRNSSGKSAIARLPLLLAASLSERAEAPIDLIVDGVDFGASFLDLIHKRRPHGAVGLGATWEDEHGRWEVWAKVQHFSELMVQVVSELRFELPEIGKVAFHWVGTDPLEDPPKYRITWNGESPEEHPVSLQGIWPHWRHELLPPAAGDEYTNLAAMNRELSLLGGTHPLASLLDHLSYLGPFREPPQRTYRYPGGLPETVGRSGVHAPALLGADVLRKGGIVLDAVSAWYRRHLGGWPLDVVRQGDTFSLVLRSPDEPTVTVNLADVGTGLSQVLPIVVQRLFESTTDKGGGLEIVEQPELHLHPGAHGDLADLYIEAVRKGASRFLIETHSENFLLRIRRRVAEGELDPDVVRIYWIDDEQQPGSSRVVPIDVLRNGEVTTWPRRVFSEDFEELKAIRSAQRALEQDK